MTSFETSPLRPIGGSFCLIDHNGRVVSDETYLGDHALIFFLVSLIAASCVHVRSRSSPSCWNRSVRWPTESDRSMSQSILNAIHRT